MLMTFLVVLCRAKDVVIKREEMAKDPALQKRLHGVTMFMAELFMNMEVSW